jgi:hypothetical protein
MVAGAAGDGEAAEWYGFKDVVSRLPDLDKLLATPDVAQIYTDISTNYALAVALAMRLTVADEAKAEAAATYLLRMPPEYTTVATMIAGKREGAVFTRSATGLKLAQALAEVTR